MFQASLTSLPPEIISAIVSMLDPFRPSLFACVLLSKECFNIFTSFLWKKISLFHEKPFATAPRKHYREAPFYQRNDWLLKLKRNIEAAGDNGIGLRLQELTLGTLITQLPEIKGLINLDPLLRILKASRQLKKLTLVQKLLDEMHPRFMDLLESIPPTVEELHFRDWDLKREKRRLYFEIHYNDEEVEEIDEGLDAFIEKVTSAAATTPALPRLKTLALKHSYGVDINK
ncbi:hypothetical protein FBU30_008614 [Linnemannia zychae]|nr:hypothetical protein FBU30_008614 [Linnemannia zychae]